MASFSWPISAALVTGQTAQALREVRRWTKQSSSGVGHGNGVLGTRQPNMSCFPSSQDILPHFDLHE